MDDPNSNQADIVEKKALENKTGRVIFILTVFLASVSFCVLIYFNYSVEICSVDRGYKKLTLKSHTYYLSIQDSELTFLSGKGKRLAAYDLRGSSVVSWFISDLNNDSSDEVLLLVSDKEDGYGEALKTLSWDGKNSVKELYKADFGKLKPWKVQTADVDGDGKKEVSLGVYKTTTFDPRLSKRPFIYNWNQQGLTPKWLGSRLSRPFEDYIFADINNDKRDELIAIELTPDKQKIVNSYSWKGFGFEGYAEGDTFKDIKDLAKEGNVLYASVEKDGKFEKFRIVVNGNKLELLNTIHF